MATHYRTYGLCLHSAFTLPLPLCPPGHPDVFLRRGDVLRRTDRAPRGNGCFQIDAVRAFLHYEQAGTLLVRSGREIVVEPAEGGDEDFLRMLLLGQGLGLLLHQRGLLTLHAGAVALDGRGVGFLGGKGYGKSTTAAALTRRGHPLITDDVLAVRGNDAPVVLPGPASVKLRPEAAVAVAVATEHLPRLSRRSTKHAWQPDAITEAPLPLRALYVLGRGAEINTRRLSPRAAFCEILRHTYTGQAALPTGTAPLQLRQCTALAGAVPVYRLERPDALDALDAFARFIEQHARSLPPASLPSPA